MKIILYNSNAPSNQLDKSDSLTVVIELEGTLRSPCSVIAPTINVKYDGFLNANYMYIEEFKRYYFIKDIISFRTNIWQVSSECDFLMSFKEDILTQAAIVKRNGDSIAWSTRIWDDKMPVTNGKFSFVYDITDDFFLSNSGDTLYYNIFVTVTGNYGDFFSDSRSDSYRENGINIPNAMLSQIGKNSCTYVFTYNRDNTPLLKNIYAEFKKFVDIVSKDSALLSQVLSVVIIPVKLSDVWIFNTTNVSNCFPVTKITLGNTDIECFCYKVKPDTILLHSITINFYNTVRDRALSEKFLRMSGYATLEVWIPYYGWRPLNPFYMFQDKDFYINYSIDITTGECNCIISDDSQIYDNFTFTIGYIMPMSSNGISDVNRVLQANAIKLQANIQYANDIWNANEQRITGSAVSNAFSSVTSGIALSAVNPVAGFATTANALGSIYQASNELDAARIERDAQINIAQSNYDAVVVMSVPHGTGGNLSSMYNNLFLNNNTMVRITYSEPLISEKTLSKYVGYPIHREMNLSDCTGYVELEDIKLHISRAYSAELRAIVKLLYNGVLFPDLPSN